jgi:nitroreductase
MNYISNAANELMPTNAVIETILSRSAAKYYDPTATLSDDEIRDLVRIGTSAPRCWGVVAPGSSSPSGKLK